MPDSVPQLLKIFCIPLCELLCHRFEALFIFYDHHVLHHDVNLYLPLNFSGRLTPEEITDENLDPGGKCFEHANILITDHRHPLFELCKLIKHLQLNVVFLPVKLVASFLCDLDGLRHLLTVQICKHLLHVETAHLYDVEELEAVRALRMHIVLATVVENGDGKADRLTDERADLVDYLSILLRHGCDDPRVRSQFLVYRYQVDSSLVRRRIVASEEGLPPIVAERSPVIFVILRRLIFQPNHLPEYDQFQDALESWILECLQYFSSLTIVLFRNLS